MHAWRSLLLRIFVVLLFSILNGRAQAPASITGTAAGIAITFGNGPFASFGYFILVPADSGSGYQLIGVYNVANDAGTYSYSPSGALGYVTFTGSLGTVSGYLDFTNSSSGSYHVSASTYFQDGTFGMAAYPAPSSIQGLSYLLTVQSGGGPFANTGKAIFTTAASGNNYAIIPVGVGVAPSSGTYAYSKVNNTLGRVQLNDTITGVSTNYIGFANAISGSYAVTQNPASAFQIGTFTNLNTTVAITTPTSGSNYTTSVSNVNLGGTAGDNLGISQVTWSNNRGGSGTASGTTSWTINSLPLQSGANIIAVIAHDTVGNTAQASISIVYFNPPTLSVGFATNSVILSWATNSAGFFLMYVTNESAATWVSNTTATSIVNGRYTVTNPIFGNTRFYRLKAPYYD